MKTIIGILIAGTVAANAGTNIELGGGMWNADVKGNITYKSTNSNDLKNDLGFSKDSFPYMYVDIKHPLRIIPNFKIEYTNINYSGSKDKTIEFMNRTINLGTVESELNLKTLDGIAYYNVIKKGGLDIDLGIDVKYIEEESSTKNHNRTLEEDIKIAIPHLYANVRYDFSCGAGIEAEGKYIKYKEAKSYDYNLKVDYKIIKGLKLEAGYKEIGLDVPESFSNDYDLTTTFNYTFSGSYAGLSYTF